MPTATYIALANLTLTGTDSVVEFSSIPNTFRDLVLVVEGTASAGVVPLVRFNNVNSGNLYTTVSAGNNVSSTTLDNSFQLPYTDWSSTSTQPTAMIWHIMDYSATDKHKTVLIRTNKYAGEVGMHAGRFASTSAISTITFSANGGTMQTNSTFALYGIVS
jgi:hypothetical protein